ncbi:MAG: histidine phosphatase family protein [Propionibacteriaceae bacterium]|jgi:probable phosphoglycerate mutase|nr:histidine phosphatase family protein [Propionibacteriaceae bacterium]
MSVRQLILVRHGVTDWNASGRAQGQEDIPLNDEGIAQAHLAAGALAKLNPTRLLSSDLSRAQMTAEALSKATGLEYQADARLQEICVGSWAGLTKPEITQLWPPYPDVLASGQDFRRSPTGETGAECGERVGAALQDIALNYDDERLIVVGHGLSLKVGLFSLMGLDYEAATRLHVLANCGWMVVTPGDRWRLRAYNITAG